MDTEFKFSHGLGLMVMEHDLTHGSWFSEKIEILVWFIRNASDFKIGAQSGEDEDDDLYDFLTLLLGSKVKTIASHSIKFSVIHLL